MPDKHDEIGNRSDATNIWATDIAIAEQMERAASFVALADEHAKDGGTIIGIVGGLLLAASAFMKHELIAHKLEERRASFLAGAAMLFDHFEHHSKARH